MLNYTIVKYTNFSIFERKNMNFLDILTKASYIPIKFPENIPTVSRDMINYVTTCTCKQHFEEN